jgi:plastocyanin
MSLKFPRPANKSVTAGGRRRWLAATGLAAIAMAAAAGSTLAADETVSMMDFEFDPATVTINVGDSVTWTNDGDAPHTATGDDFDTGLVNPGDSDSVTFDTAGSFDYVCTLHPQMTGTVTVEAAGTTEPTDDASPTGGDTARPTLPVGTDTVNPTETPSGTPVLLVVLTLLAAATLGATLAVARIRR